MNCEEQCDKIYTKTRNAQKIVYLKFSNCGCLVFYGFE